MDGDGGFPTVTEEVWRWSLGTSYALLPNLPKLEAFGEGPG